MQSFTELHGLLRDGILQQETGDRDSTVLVASITTSEEVAATVPPSYNTGAMPIRIGFRAYTP